MDARAETPLLSLPATLFIGLGGMAFGAERLQVRDIVDRPALMPWLDVVDLHGLDIATGRPARSAERLGRQNDRPQAPVTPVAQVQAR